MEKILNQNDSKERVAFDLMTAISNAEYRQDNNRIDDRNYYITLFRQCLYAVSSPEKPE